MKIRSIGRCGNPALFGSRMLVPAKDNAPKADADTEHDFRFKFQLARFGETCGLVRYRRRLCRGMGKREAGAGNSAASAVEAGALEDLLEP